MRKRIKKHNSRPEKSVPVKTEKALPVQIEVKPKKDKVEHYFCRL